MCVETGGQPSTAITAQPRSWYSIFCNRWLALLGVSTCFVYCVNSTVVDYLLVLL